MISKYEVLVEIAKAYDERDSLADERDALADELRRLRAAGAGGGLDDVDMKIMEMGKDSLIEKVGTYHTVDGRLTAEGEFVPDEDYDEWLSGYIGKSYLPKEFSFDDVASHCDAELREIYKAQLAKSEAALRKRREKEDGEEAEG